MKKLVYFAISLFLSVTLASHCACRKAPSRAKQRYSSVAFEDARVNIGAVYAELVPFGGSFYFTNGSDHPIELDAKACCSSRITFKDGKTLYQPGEQGELLFQITGVPNSAYGLIEKTAKVFENGKSEPVAVLKLIAQIKRKWRVRPARLDFGKLNPAQLLTAKLEIVSGTEDQLRITGLSKSLPPFMKVDLIAKTDLNDRMKYQYNVSVTGAGKARHISENIVFATTSSQVPEISVPVKAQMVAPVIVKPQSIFFGRLSRGASASRNLRIISTCRETLNLLGVRSRPDNMLQTRLADPNAYAVGLDIVFTCPPDVHGVVRGSLEIAIDRTCNSSQEAMHFTVPCIAIVQSD